MKRIIVTAILIMGLVAFGGITMATAQECGNFAEAGAGASATIETGAIQFPETKDLTTSNVNAKGYRPFPEAGNVPMAPLPGYFGEATKGSQYQSVPSMITYKDTFTVDEMEKMAKGLWGSKPIVTPLVDKVAKEDLADTIKVSVEKQEGARLLGYITVKATSEGTVSPEILAEAMLAARELGANTVHVSADGVERVLKALGWGIGFSHTSANLDADETQGGLSAGGMGISGGKAGYHDNPWIQLFALEVK